MSLLNANSYKKGSWVLRMLRSEVGDKAFLDIVRAYYERYKGGNAETKDFEIVAEKISGKELSWFFDQWLHRPGIPVLEISTKIQNHELFLYVEQQAQPYRFNLEVAIVDGDGEIRKEIFLVQNKESEFKVKVKGSSAKYSIDPDAKLLYRLKK